MRVFSILGLSYIASWMLLFIYSILLFVPELMLIEAPSIKGYVASFCFNLLVGMSVSWVLCLLGELLCMLNKCLYIIWHLLVSLLILVFSSTDVFLISVFNLQWNAFTFQLINETNTTEMIGFFQTYGRTFHLSAILLTAIVLVVLAIFLLKRVRWQKLNPSLWIVKSRIFVVSIFVGLIAIEGRCFTLDHYVNMTKSDKLLRRDCLWNLYQSVLIYYGESELMDACIQSQSDLRADFCNYTSSNIVLIIGETYNKHHSSLYGYNLVTNPQCSILNPIVFDDVISPANATTTVFKYLMSFAATDDSSRWCDGPLFPALFKWAGYNIVFYSNQYVSEGNLNYYDASAGFFNHPAIYSKLFDNRNHERYSYDMQLVDAYRTKRKDLEKDSLNLIIFHLIGQHSPAVERFPSDSASFKLPDVQRPDLADTERQYIADYDNATLYNDAVVSEIVRMYADKDAIVLYVADHGEEIYDFRNKAGRFNDFDKTGSEGLHNQLDVPFWVFASDKYIEKHSCIIENIMLAKNKPFMTDLFPHLLLGLAGIRTEWYDDSKDLFNPNYDTSRHRKISGSNIDYDSKCKKE